MSISALKAAGLVATHTLACKLIVTAGLRVFQMLQSDPDARKKLESNKYVVRFCKAQMNESEYSAFILSLLFYIGSNGSQGEHLGATLAAAGQIAYVWMRTIFGYPGYITAGAAIVRYAGLALIVQEIWSLTNSK